MQIKPITLSLSLTDRFWSHVDKTGSPHGCWLWVGATDKRGYGQIRQDKHQLIQAHRLSYLIHFGDIHSDLLVLHNCPDRDNPACVNPSHLWLGTNDENMRDMKIKGRQRRGQPLERLSGQVCRLKGAERSKLKRGRAARGEEHGLSKLNDAIIQQIRTEYAAGTISQRALAKLFGISGVTVFQIVNRKTWRHVA